MPPAPYWSLTKTMKKRQNCQINFGDLKTAILPHRLITWKVRRECLPKMSPKLNEKYEIALYSQNISL